MGYSSKATPSMQTVDKGPRWVTGILGSPNREGNTAHLLSAVLTGIESTGLGTRRIRLGELKIAPCIGCGKCKLGEGCILHDGMDLVYPEIDRADGIVLATPIYFMGVTAQTKAMIDRCQGYWFKHFGGAATHRGTGFSALGTRPALFLATAGGRWPRTDSFTGAKSVVKAFFNTMGYKYWGELIVDDTDQTPVWDREETIASAFETGRRIAREIGEP